jgi:hypothetical protein
MSAAVTHIHSLIGVQARTRIAFLTCHDKTPLVAGPLADLGFRLEPLNCYDTDHFGTFCREVPKWSVS